jgi:fermentation-respiration switch protein FrsA (DUF1100 family)
MRWIAWPFLIAAGGYVALLMLMYAGQRKLQYVPDPVRRPPAAVGLPQAEERVLETTDGERVTVWHVPPRADKPVVIYFQGNGGGLDLRAKRFRRLIAEGIGLVALNYRGYGGSSGSPTEAGLIADANAAYAFAIERYPVECLVLWGESLGTGVATALAAERPIARLLLESPFTSITDVAAHLFWYLPVRLFVQDTFRSDLRIPKVSAPVLILHGERDTGVPIGLAERLYAKISAQRQFVRLPKAEHNDHDEHGALELVLPFVTGQALS